MDHMARKALAAGRVLTGRAGARKALREGASESWHFLKSHRIAELYSKVEFQL